jgi:hypothetical protein
MRKLTPELFATYLVLIVVAPGQVAAAIQTSAKKDLLSMVVSRSDGVSKTDDTGNKDVALLTSTAIDRSGTRTRLTTAVDAPARSPFRVVNAPQANATLGFSLPGADDFTLGRNNGYGTELRRRVVFNQHDVVGASQGEVVTANGGSGQTKAIQTVRDKDSEAAKVTFIANAKLAPVATLPVPEPGGWAMVLAGLLGVIAIARRRMSL